ncbi:MAG: SDR family NAD(P)-dependent oxidoreductase [Rudaea sp.]|nr:SDR family NAD(P)-dependent oxidoreductase [Rudaea sp.]
MTQQLRYDGKVAVITGAGNGLGRAYALMLGARGAKVVVNDLGGGAFGDGKSSNAADTVVDEIKALGGQAIANYDSVTDGDKIVKTALDAFGTVDIVINNAGILRDISFAKMSDDDWNRIYQVHVYGAYKVTHAAWPVLREKNYGRIIFTASAAGIYGNFGQANYSMAKLGLHGFAQTLAEEGRSKGIHVNTIAPIAASRLTETILPPDVLAKLSPDYVSPLVGWLCHEDCAETKGLFEVGAGFVGKLRWERSEGHFFHAGRKIDVENVAAAWNEIGDFTRKNEHPAAMADAFAPLLARVDKPSLGGNEYIDLDEALAAKLESESSYDERDLALYALGIGAARDALDANELKFAYELGDGFQALPTYAVIPPTSAMLAMVKEGRSVPGIRFGLETVLHGEQYTEVFRPLPPKAKLRHVFKVKAAYDKAPNAVVVFATETFDESGERLAYNEMSAFVRGAGGWGGERGPAGEINVPPAREADATLEERVDANQALLYRLSGDWNPLHADPAFAQAFGFEKPILHGLCTFGIAGRHVVRAFCAGDARKFKSIKVRFAESVYPGETLVTRMWKESDTRIVFETRVKERDKVVLRNAAVELYREIPQIQAKPAVAEATPRTEAATTATALSAADVFAAIGKHLALHKGLGDQIKTSFQFDLCAPDSTWTLDLKSGDGAVRQGPADKPDTTLSLSHADFIDMSTGKVDPNKLYFGGKLKIAGNVMASQKLGFLQKIDPKLLRDIVAQRGENAVPAAAAPAAHAVESAQAAAQASAAAPLFAALADKLKTNPKAADGLGGRVVVFKLRDPDASWVIDLSGKTPKVELGENAQATAVFGLSDADFIALAKGNADARDLYQRGSLRVDGDMRLAHELDFLKGTHS